MTSLLCFVAISDSVVGTPIESELKLGKQLFAKGKGIDRTEKDSRIVIGQWFDGERNQNVEEVVFVTPGLLSRWLGYQLAAGTSQEVVNATWEKCAGQFTGKTFAVVRLARLCTVDMIDGDVDNSAKPEALDKIKIEMHQVDKPWTPVDYHVVQDIQQRRPDEVLKDTWDQVLAKFTAWPSKPTENDLMPEIRWGLNRRVSLIAETTKFEPGSKCEIKILEKDRTRVIPFHYPKS